MAIEQPVYRARAQILPYRRGPVLEVDLLTDYTIEVFKPVDCGLDCFAMSEGRDCRAPRDGWSLGYQGESSSKTLQ